MREIEIAKRLRAISDQEWSAVIKKCFGHVELRLGDRTLFGAHSEKRLGIRATDYYVGNAIKALYEQSWDWQFEKYTITEQLIRVINSMISNEVAKFKTEQKQSKQLPLLIQNDLFITLVGEAEFDKNDDDEYTEKCKRAIELACKDNIDKRLIELRMQGKNYLEIAEELNCSRDKTYRIMENIARRAKNILKNSKHN